ncbi:hypothetical protein H4217_008205 [Coemansia sp. RSA 1939]|nr:hypothetical protein H4217_008205 [Coemansia sp. RSA 1939]KAJ2595347.1 hypothetical protein EV177_008159 [Coemansia sp. RSA 1804]KAJ2680314.1 hypothetical protein GGH99_005435 [Coemansia sp. RSA 1285]
MLLAQTTQSGLATSSHNAFAQDRELSQSEAKALVQQLSGRLIDTLYELRAQVEQKRASASSNANADAGVQNRAKDDDDVGDSDDDSTTKLINKAANALRPVIKELASVVNGVLPAGPSRQLVKATANAVDSLMPLILKYALGI